VGFAGGDLPLQAGDQELLVGPELGGGPMAATKTTSRDLAAEVAFLTRRGRVLQPPTWTYGQEPVIRLPFIPSPPAAGWHGVLRPQPGGVNQTVAGRPNIVIAAVTAAGAGLLDRFAEATAAYVRALTR
jgi:hypothetical protein